jgi:hypothetical protein
LNTYSFRLKLIKPVLNNYQSQHPCVRDQKWLADEAMRDLYWCAVLKFMRTLLLTTPTDAAMAGMLGVLEPMCNKDEVEEIGASMEESDERDAIYGHHRA